MPGSIYEDIARRTGGEIYIGVVGPVRTGKSTFIKRFMEGLVLPGMEEGHDKEIARDEMPQSAGGKTIMTTEPKFIPKNAAELNITPELSVKVRLVDCVGFLAEGAAGHQEDGQERMVKTPWFDEEIPFSRAAEIGTRKVITDHATIGMMVTTDGTITELPREAYLKAEEKTAAELKKMGKPFVILLNSVRPYSEETKSLAKDLEDKYRVSVMPVSCEQLKAEDILNILQHVLMEFPVVRLEFHIPRWMEILAPEHPLKARVLETFRGVLGSVHSMKDVNRNRDPEKTEGVRLFHVSEMDLSDGCVHYQIEVEDSYYYDTISHYAGIPIQGEYQLMKTVRELAMQKSEYQRVRQAMEEVRQTGYGIVVPERSEIHLEEPEIMKQGGRFGVRMHAEAPSIHMIRTMVSGEIAPVVGTEAQAQDLVQYIKSAGEDGAEGIWETNIFGKSIGQIVDESIRMKTSQMSEGTQQKLQNALQKIINKGSGGLICIII